MFRKAAKSTPGEVPMLKPLTLQFAVLALASGAWAAAPLGSVSSAEPFELNGSAVPMAGVPSWPVSAGDMIVTRWAPATIVFRDGSRVVVARDSKVRIEATGNAPVLRLLQGSGRYNLPAKPSLTLFVRDKPAPAKPASQGSFALPSANAQVNDGAGNGDGDKDHDKPPHPSPHQ
jgi:hypothetical protein